MDSWHPANPELRDERIPNSALTALLEEFIFSIIVKMVEVSKTASATSP
jgi:hypothetical protein